MNKVISEHSGNPQGQQAEGEKDNQVSWVEWERVSFITFTSDIYDISLIKVIYQ